MEMNERGFALLAPLLGDVCLLSGFATWILIVWWLWLRGWRVQRRYFIEATLPPLRRTQITWMSALIGVLAVIAAHSTPSAAALVSVAMIGTLSALTDVRTHKLPNAYTGAMAVGVSIGCACAVLVSDSPTSVLADVAWGGAIWAVPMWLLSRLPGGVGFGDVKLAPVLGAMLGTEGITAAVFGLFMSVIAAGLGAVWRLVIGSAGTSSRMPLGPWLVVGSMIAHILHGVIPQWT